MFSGLSNAIEATSKEEEIHGKFGIALYKIIRMERPEMFNDEFFARLTEHAEKAFHAEMEIVDWIYEAGDLPFARKEVVKNFVAQRYNKAFIELGLNPLYETNEEYSEETKWFDIEVVALKEIDFFNKRSTDYSKKDKPVTPDDLF